MSQSRWRNIAAPIIRRVLTENAMKPEKEIRAALREAYPFGPREFHPYKIWCDEIQLQRGKKKPKTRRRAAADVSLEADPRQIPMFSEVMA